MEKGGESEAKVRMNILVLTDKRYLGAAVAVAPGADVWVFPPMTAGDFRPEFLKGYEFIYVDLHGQPESVYLYCDEGEHVAALSVQTVRSAEIGDAVVFMTSCYGPETPFVKAFLGAGASGVVAGYGVNWGTRKRLSGAQLLGKYFMEMLNPQISVAESLQAAKGKLKQKGMRSMRKSYRKAAQDALEFEVFIIK